MSDPPLDPEKLLGKPMTLRRRDVSRAAGVSLVSARRFWRALGFPNVGDDVTAFTEADVLALHRITTLVRDGLLDEATALGMTRAIGRSADRLASWQVQLLAEYVAGLTTPEDAVAGRSPRTPTRHSGPRSCFPASPTSSSRSCCTPGGGRPPRRSPGSPRTLPPIA
jgi:hypothetical protein